MITHPALSSIRHDAESGIDAERCRSWPDSGKVDRLDAKSFCGSLGVSVNIETLKCFIVLI